jgi:hypothetical protein
VTLDSAAEALGQQTGREVKLCRERLEAMLTLMSRPETNAVKLAVALRVSPSDLLPPSDIEGEITYPVNVISMGDGTARVQLDVAVPFHVAVQIMQIVAKAVSGSDVRGGEDRCGADEVDVAV